MKHKVKQRKKIGTVAISIMLLVGAIITILGDKKLKLVNTLEKGQEVYLFNDMQQYNEAICKLGVQEKGVNKLNSKYISIELTKMLDRNILTQKDIDEMQLLYNISQGTFNQPDWNTLLEICSERESVSYIGLVNDSEVDKQQKLDLYHLLSQIIKDKDYENISVIYYINDLEDLNELNLKQMQYIGINLDTQEDIEVLEQVHKKVDKNEINIIINDYLGNENTSLKQILDNINRFYYSIPIEYSNVELVFNQTNWDSVDDKVKEIYAHINSQPWLTAEKEIINQTPYKPVDNINTDINGNIEVITWGNPQDIDYVVYKINEEQILQGTRFPYNISLDTNKLTQGLNKINVIIYLRGEEESAKREFYLDVQEVKDIPQKANRKSEGYSIEQNPIYKRPYIPVLMYHEFKQVVSDEDTSIAVSNSLFEEQLKALLEDGYTPINFVDLNQYLNKQGGLPDKPVIITTDDGYLSNYTEAYPILKKYGVQATYFITTQYVGVNIGLDHFTWEQAKEMEESGLIDIQTHTHSHRLLNETYKEDILYQVDRSFGLIEQKLGKRDIKVLAYPQFRHNKYTQELVSSLGVDLQITNLARKTSKTTPIEVKRIHVSNDMIPQVLIDKIKERTK